MRGESVRGPRRRDRPWGRWPPTATGSPTGIASEDRPSSDAGEPRTPQGLPPEGDGSSGSERSGSRQRSWCAAVDPPRAGVRRGTTRRRRSRCIAQQRQASTGQDDRGPRSSPRCAVPVLMSPRVEVRVGGSERESAPPNHGRTPSRVGTPKHVHVPMGSMPARRPCPSPTHEHGVRRGHRDSLAVMRQLPRSHRGGPSGLGFDARGRSRTRAPLPRACRSRRCRQEARSDGTDVREAERTVIHRAMTCGGHHALTRVCLRA